jgi:hypothetical protein
MKNVSRFISLVILVSCLSSLFAQTTAWKLLGTKKVALNTDRDVISVGADEGTFKAIKLTVTKSGVQFKDMKVHFSNGTVIDVNIRRLIPAGGETRVIDLPGANRNIQKVVFWYESTERNKKRATVRLWGLR